MGKTYGFKTDHFLYLFLLLALFAYRYLVLEYFGFQYTDYDQVIMWLAAQNYGHGLFHEPLFYGQSYNTMLEAFLAVPFVKTGISLHKALPLVTTLLTILPFLLLSFLSYFHWSHFSGFIPLFVLVFMPVEYGFLTSISRGFVSGLGIVGLSIFSLFYIKQRWAIFLLGISGALGYLGNPNALLLWFPIAIYGWLNNIQNIRFYLYLVIGLVLGSIIYYSAIYFYYANPGYNLHLLSNDFDLDHLLEGLKNLGPFFNYVTPFLIPYAWIWIFMPLLVGGFFLIKKQFKPALVCGIIPFLLLSPLIASKIHDGTSSVFFSNSRMFLAFPMILSFILALLKFKPNKWLLYGIIVLALSFLVYKASILPSKVEENLNKDHYVVVSSKDKVYNNCEKLKSLADKHDIDLIINAKGWFSWFYNYACPAIYFNSSFPKTLRPSYERRTWRLIEDENKIYTNILIYDKSEPTLAKQFDFVQKVSSYDDFYLIKDNNTSTLSLLDKLNIKVRKYQEENIPSYRKRKSIFLP